MIGFTDSHCHLNFNLFKNDLDETLERAFSVGINRILIPGTDLQTSQLAVELSNQYPELYAAVGIHPNDANSWNDNTASALLDLANQPKVVAIGEIGLDYYRDYAPKSLQLEVLKNQLSIAARKNLPIIIHNRDAFIDLWPMLVTWRDSIKETNPRLFLYPGVLHSFDGDLSMAEKAIQNHFLLGITGPVTFKNATDRQKIVSELPLQSLLLETDSPFLTPQPLRGRRNEPAYTKVIAQKIADLHHITLDQIANTTSQNANNLFAWRAFG